MFHSITNNMVKLFKWISIDRARNILSYTILSYFIKISFIVLSAIFQLNCISQIRLVTSINANVDNTMNDRTDTGENCFFDFVIFFGDFLNDIELKYK